jgi:putative restriction endonuclease
MKHFIALTDKAWFDYLSRESRGQAIDEVNFWSPRSRRPMKLMSPGEPVFFRLKEPHSAIVGYGFFALFRVLDLDTAWELFGWKNGDPDKVRFLERIGGYRGLDLLNPRTSRDPLGCTILRDAAFWERSRWIPWDERMGWSKHTQRGKVENNPGRIDILFHGISGKAPAELATDAFRPLEVDDRRIVLGTQTAREGQGTFRARLLDAYRGRCAITGEHTEPVLDAAHIQPYCGPRSNHVQNGLMLTKEFHALFDRGYVTVSPEYVIRVSARLRSEWKNGHRYLPYDGKPLVQLPDRKGDWPSREALRWHNSRIYRRAEA